jgi:hypothetical protein
MQSIKLKKMVALGLSAILFVDPKHLPVSIKQRMPKIAAFLLELEMLLWEQRDEEEKMQKAQEAGITKRERD